MLGELIKATPLKKNKDKNISTTVYSSLESLKNDSLSVYQFFDVTIVTALFVYFIDEAVIRATFLCHGCLTFQNF